MPSLVLKKPTKMHILDYIIQTKFIETSVLHEKVMYEAITSVTLVCPLPFTTLFLRVCNKGTK